MKKILVVLALAAFASTASATIENSRHDLSKGYNGNPGKLGSCAYCHAPHLWVGSNLPAGETPPLWNRNSTAAGDYTIWNTKYTKANPPGTRSLTCLSCHDGAFDLGQVNNGAYGSLGTINAVANVGLDLTDDHPVGMPYDTSAGVASQLVFVPVGVRLRASTAGVLQVECSSCHDPHNTTTGPDGGRFFLRVATDKLCGACHLK